MRESKLSVRFRLPVTRRGSVKSRVGNRPKFNPVPIRKGFIVPLEASPAWQKAFFYDLRKSGWRALYSKQAGNLALQMIAKRCTRAICPAIFLLN
jgi:hypothetical protein